MHNTNAWLLLVFVGLAALHFAVRMILPPPPDDVKAIELFLKNREESLVRLNKMIWIGGLVGDTRWRAGSAFWGQSKSNIRGYRILARDKEGSLFVHHLAANALDRTGARVLLQRSYGVWTAVLQ